MQSNDNQFFPKNIPDFFEGFEKVDKSKLFSTENK